MEMYKFYTMVKLTKEERIILRDELFDIFKIKKIVYLIKGTYVYRNKSNIIKMLDENELEKYNKYISCFLNKDEGLFCIIRKDDYSNHICPVCKLNSCKFHDNIYRKSCSKLCSEQLSNSQEAKEKTKVTCLEKYGVEHFSKSDLIKEKKKNTSLQKFGTEYTFQAESVKNKIKNTLKEKYGVEHPLQSKEISERFISTCVEKFGDTNPFKNEKVKEKIKQSILAEYGVENIKQKDIINYDIYSDNEKFKEYIINKYNEKGSFLLLNECNTFFNISTEALKRKLDSLGLTDYFYIQKSNLEVFFDTFLKENELFLYKTKIFNKDKNLIREIDFYCKEYKIGFEINDIATHNSLDLKDHKTYKDKYYHYNKSTLAKENNIRLIHIWEWELRNSKEWDRLSRWILDLLNTNKTNIDVKECSMQYVQCEKEKEFLNNYSLEGYTRSDICIGLYHKNELIQLISFKKIEDNKYKIIRMNTKYNYDINNGFKILLEVFKSTYNPESIVAYCNLDKYTPSIYKELGFKLINTIEPEVIFCNKDMNHFTLTDNIDIDTKEYLPLYNCGYEVYKYKCGGDVLKN